MWSYGTGGYRFFQGTSGTLTSPAEDNGSLTKNGDGSFTYSAPDGSTIGFDSGGKQSSSTSADGKETISVSYDGSGRVSTLTAIDGGASTFTYSNNSNTLLSSIAAPGSRTWSFTTSGTDLTTITDPDSKTHGFTYSNHRATAETRGSALANQYHYASTGLLDQITWGTSSSPSVTTISPVWSQGLSAPVLGEPAATVTDALGNKTVARLDSSGRLVYVRAADGGVTTTTRDSAGRVASLTDPLARTTSFTRDSLGYVTQVTLPDSNTQSYTYQTAFHAMTSATDERGNETDFGHDSSGHLTSVTDALSNETDYGYSGTTGLLISITDPQGRETDIGYDSSRRANSITTPLGTTSSTFDTTTGEVATATDALSQVTTTAYDSMGRPTSITHPDTYAEYFVYNNSSLLQSHTDKTGVPMSPVYDTYGRGLTTNVNEATGSLVARDTMNTFDAAGRPTSTRDPQGYVTAVTLDPVGRVIKTTDSLGHTTRAAYDLAGQLVASRDQSGFWTTQVYNSRGEVTQTTDGRGNSWSFTFDEAGNPLTTTDPLNHTVTATFDELNRESSVTDALNHTVSQTYWPDGRKKDFTDARGYVTRTDVDFTNQKNTVTEAYGISAARTTEEYFDDIGQTTSLKNGLGTTVASYTRNSVGDVTAVADALSHSTSMTVDKEHRVTQVTDPLSKHTDITLDALGRQAQVSDPTGNKTSSLLDARDSQAGALDGLDHLSQSVTNAVGDTTHVIDPISGTTKQEYDSAGHLIALTDPDGNRTTWEYDANGNVTKETDPLGKTRTWEFDAANRLTTYTDRLGRQKLYTYLDNNLVSTEVWKNAGGTTVNTTSYTYNENNQVLTVGDNNGSYTLTYDEVGRVATRQDPWGITLTYTWDDADRVTQITDSKGGTQDFVFDDAGRLTSQKFSATGQQARVDFTYNNRNEVTNVKRYDDNAGTTLRSETVYAFDDAGRVTSITHKNGSGTTIDSFDYQYDSAGRVTQVTSTLGPTENYNYDDSSQILGDGSNNFSFDLAGNRTMTGYSTGTGNRTTSDGVYTYTWDDEGNLATKSKSGEYWSYTFDVGNHLTDVKDYNSQGGTLLKEVKLTYDVFGNDIKKELDANGDGTFESVNKFAFDEKQNGFLDLDSSGSLTTRRLYAPAVDALFARIGASGNEDWLLDDRLGSLRDIVNSSGTLVDHIDYSVWGKTTSETSPSNGDRHGFTSRPFDSDIGLQNNRARWYSFTIGWISEDPAAADVNLYRYVGNDVTNASDPSGLVPDNGLGEIVADFADQFRELQAAGLAVMGGSPVSQADFDRGIAIYSAAYQAEYARYAAMGIDSDATLDAAEASGQLALSSFHAIERRLRGPREPRRLSDRGWEPSHMTGAPVPLEPTPAIPAINPQANVWYGLRPEDWSLGGSPEWYAAQRANARSLIGMANAAGIVSPPFRYLGIGMEAMYDLSGVEAAASPMTMQDIANAWQPRLRQPRFGALQSAQTLTHRNGIFEVLAQQGISGRTRSAHRRAANRGLLQRLEADPQLNRNLSATLGVQDVAAHMRSGLRSLRNPPGTEWHHPIENPNAMILLRRQVHRHPELQGILHPNNVGGFGTHYGK